MQGDPKLSPPSSPLVRPRNLVWFLPSYHGDIRLEQEGPELTMLRAFELTPTERKAMEQLRDRAVSPKLRQPWAADKDFLPLTNAAYATADGVTIHLKAPVEKVQDVLFKAMKAKRKAVMAVRFSDGSMEEIVRVQTPEGKEAKLPGPKPAKEAEPEKTKAKEKEEAKPVVAATVARPVNGCPMPAFEEATIRANRVLEAFLTDEQRDDYRKSGAFIVHGRDSGHRYMICNRERPNFYNRHMGGRQLWDMEEKRPICVHDWTVPAPEEMLGIFFMLTLPGREIDLLNLPEQMH